MRFFVYLSSSENTNDNLVLENDKLTLSEYEFWTKKIHNKDNIIMNTDEINQFNLENLKLNENLIHIELLSEDISKAELTKMISNNSIIPKGIRFDINGIEIKDEWYSNIFENIGISGIAEINVLRYGLTNKRTVLRTFPTYLSSYNTKGDTDFDRFVETAIYPLESLVIYWETMDGQWIFGSIYNYTGWIPKKDISIGLKEDIFHIINKDEFLTVISSQVIIEDIRFDMGVRIPLKEVREDGYHVYIPAEEDQELYKIVEITKGEDFSLGYLPYTKDNLLKQAFKLYGEPYGWGGMNNSRDCSALIMDVHRVFGFKLPRNSEQQALNPLGINYDFNENDLQARLKVLDTMEVGTALYMPGHTMIYIGKNNDQHYMIHQYVGHYEEIDNRLEYIEAMKTDITPVTIMTSTGISYLERVYVGKEFKR